MSTAVGRPYYHIGVFLPVQSRNDAPDRIAREWPRIDNAHVASKGFLLGDLAGMRNYVFIAQSIQTNELLVHKLLWPRRDGPYLEPRELRISTWQDTLPSVEFPNANPLGVLPQDAPFFNKLKFWQQYTPDVDAEDQNTAYSLYFEHCNGGDLADLINKYNSMNVAVPEHFIWLVAEQLCLAIAWLHFGERPNVPGHQAPDNWTALYHRDLNPGNVFVNYPPRGRGRIPAVGDESNAFPQIILGDFGMAERDGDIPANEGGGAEAWEDIYGVGMTLRNLCQAHLPVDKGDVGTTDHGDQRPNNVNMAELNARDGSAPDFSGQLINLLRNFEWDDMDENSIFDLQLPEQAMPATSRWIVDTLYPAARARVAAYRSPPGRRPAGYFDRLDASWTKPTPSMPFVYVSRYADLARDGGDRQDGDDEEVTRMKQLALLHQWEGVKPSFELRSVEFNRPTMKPWNMP